jgi:hypothetical protein
MLGIELYRLDIYHLSNLDAALPVAHEITSRVSPFGHTYVWVLISIFNIRKWLQNSRNSTFDIGFCGLDFHRKPHEPGDD